MGPVDLPAGRLSTWLAELRSGDGTDVPCGECDACCRSSMFVHVEPDEVETLRRIPKALRFPAPGMPRGNVVLPFDADGRCPMLTDAGCSIYEARPRTCRRFDCRIFAAASIEPHEPLIADRVRRWSFEVPTEEEQQRLSLIRRLASEQASGGRPADVAIDALRRSG